MCTLTPQASRHRAFHRVSELLEQAAAAGGGARALHLIIVDDNLQYRSMRAQCFQLARNRERCFLYCTFYLIISCMQAPTWHARLLVLQTALRMPRCTWNARLSYQ